MFSFNMFSLFEMTLGNFMKCSPKKAFNTKRAAEAALLDDIIAQLPTVLMMLHVHFRISTDLEIITFPNSRRSDNDDGEQEGQKEGSKSPPTF
ncbi:hypothetical protein ACIQYG_08245 [Peribacillus sp. NPDC096622]|uniref:hypothetical protein n=1 Tax=Peribacillus sp. NPDC096622 TaxID=3364396 RepID=UPI003810DE4E